MSALYQRRVEQEWRLLADLAAANPFVLSMDGRRTEDGIEVFQFTLRQTPALVMESEGPRLRHTHGVFLRFPRFFPAVPSELSLASPVFHPNVHPENGFVCLWDRFSAKDTVVETVAQLQRVITWQLFNEVPDHLMQPAALAWYKNPARDLALPLVVEALRRPAGLDLISPTNPGPRRKRLS
jgi:Ubiquitin-conjugating enzyme